MIVKSLVGRSFFFGVPDSGARPAKSLLDVASRRYDRRVVVSWRRAARASWTAPGAARFRMLFHTLFLRLTSDDGNGRFVRAADHREGCHDPATCPICQYLAQGQVIGERVEAVSVAASVPNRSLIIPLFLPSIVLQPFQARAPRLPSLSTLIWRSKPTLPIAGCVVSRALSDLQAMAIRA